MKMKPQPTRASFFNPNQRLLSKASEIKVLEAEEKQLMKSPAQALKSLALLLFRENNLDQAGVFSQVALALDPQIFKDTVNHSDDTGNVVNQQQALWRLIDFRLAVKEGYLEVVKAHLDSDVVTEDDLCLTDQEGNNVLHLAVLGGAC